LQLNAFNKVTFALLIKMLVEDQLRKRKLLGCGGWGCLLGTFLLSNTVIQAMQESRWFLQIHTTPSCAHM